MKLYISNAFSLSMLDRDSQKGSPPGYCPRDSDAPLRHCRIPRPVDDPKRVINSFMASSAEIISVIGHADTAAVLSEALGMELAPNRVSVKLSGDAALLVGQYIGPRLEEGATSLPEGATIEWWLV